MAATLAVDSGNKLVVATLGGGDAQPSRVNWSSDNVEIVRLQDAGQGILVEKLVPVQPGVATVTAVFLDAFGNTQQTQSIHVQVTGSDPYTATVASTGAADTVLPTPGNVDPNAPQAAHQVTSGQPVTVAAGAGAGTAPPAPTATGDDAHGVVSWGTGTAPAVGAQVAVTFRSPYPTVPSVVLTPGNDATQPLGLEATNVTVNGFTISAHVAPGISQAAGTYAAQFEVQD